MLKESPAMAKDGLGASKSARIAAKNQAQASAQEQQDAPPLNPPFPYRISPIDPKRLRLLTSGL
jgi:hypothetical protein